MIVGPVQGSVPGPSFEIGPMTSHVPPSSAPHSQAAPGEHASEWAKPGEQWAKPGEQWAKPSEHSEWPKPGEHVKPSEWAKPDAVASAAGSIGKAAVKSKRDLLVAALVGAIAGGGAGTIAGGGAGLGAGWVSAKPDTDVAVAEESADVAASGAQGSLRVLSQPSGAAVAMDDHALGSTPVDVRAVSGMHTIRVALDGYEPHVVHASVPAGDSLTLSVALSAVPEVAEEAAPTAPSPRPAYRARPPPRRDCDGERRECERACGSAQTDCDFSCPGCSSCSDGWENCRPRCETCRQSCRNNRGFCESQCRSQESACNASQR